VLTVVTYWAQLCQLHSSTLHRRLPLVFVNISISNGERVTCITCSKVLCSGHKCRWFQLVEYWIRGGLNQASFPARVVRSANESLNPLAAPSRHSRITDRLGRYRIPHWLACRSRFSMIIIDLIIRHFNYWHACVVVVDVTVTLHQVVCQPIHVWLQSAWPPNAPIQVSVSGHATLFVRFHDTRTHPKQSAERKMWFKTLKNGGSLVFNPC
jgi:hypothetical protein